MPRKMDASPSGIVGQPEALEVSRVPHGIWEETQHFEIEEHGASLRADIPTFL